MDSDFTIEDKLRLARIGWHVADKRARNPRTDPRLACEAEQERFRCAAIIADLEEKIETAGGKRNTGAVAPPPQRPASAKDVPGG